MKSVFMILGLVLATQSVEARGRGKPQAPNFAESCGNSIKEVAEVTRTKFPDMGTGHIRLYLGEWNYGSMASIEITEGRKFKVMNREVVICPRADKKFDVYWSDSKDKVGILGMVSRNQVMAYGTSHGDIPFDRAGSQTAGN